MMDPQALKELSREVEQIARQTGRFLMEELGRVGDHQIEEKALNSLVSYVDRQAEAQLVEALGRLLPEAVFLTEEDTIQNQYGSQQWIIDPLDGTTNFLHQLPAFVVSLGLRLDEELCLGVVYDPSRRECFSAWRHGGAYLNHHPIGVSHPSGLDRSLLATGFPYYDYERLQAYLEVLRYFMQHSQGIRRFGSAALDLAYVACGRFDGFFEYSLQPWDVAAGAVLVREAGGLVTDFSGGGRFLFGEELIAASPEVHPVMLHQIREAFGSSSSKSNS